MSKDAEKSEPSMDDILASIRRIIDEDGGKGRKPATAAAGKAATDILELTEMVNEDGSVTSLQKPAGGPSDLAPKPIEDDEPPIYADRDERDRPQPFITPEPARPAQPESRPATPAAGATAQPAPTPPRPQPQPAPMPSGTPQPPRIMTTPNMGGISLTPVNTPPQQPAAPPAQSGLVSGQTANAATAAFDRLAQAALQQQPPAAPTAPKAPSPTVGGRALEDMVGEMLRPMLQQWLDTNLPSIVERLVQQEIQKMSKR